MRQVTIPVDERAFPLRKPGVGSLAWGLSLVSIFIALVSIGVAVQQALVTGNYRAFLTHQSLTPFITTGFAIVGALVASRHPRNPIGWIFVAVGLLYAFSALAAVVFVYGSHASPVYDWAVWLGSWLWLPAIILPMTFVLLLFPDGHLPSSRWRLVGWSAALGLAMTVLGVMLHPGPLDSWNLEANPFGIPGAAPLIEKVLNAGSILIAVSLVGSLAAFLLRFRRSRGIQREQMKWLVYAVTLNLFISLLLSVLWFFLPDFSGRMEISILVSNLTILGVGVAAAVAILRYRLYDIDLIINRTLVYSALTIGVAALYGLVVGGVGAIFEARSSLFVSLLAAALAAILVQPMRDALQRMVNRLMYGERDDPYAVLSSLSRRLEGSLSAEATLPAVVETVANTLKLPYVAIALKQEGEYKDTASYGLPVGELLHLPLFYQGETVGQLRLSTRAPNEPFTPGEQRLLRDIARHIGVTAHTVLLTRDLRQLAEDLQRSRERLVTAREEERRRLRRDLHDGLGPVLASQGLKLAALQQLSSRDPQAAGKLLDQLIARNESAVAEIRRLVYGLRPPALDELGLVEAVRDQVMAGSDSSRINLPVDTCVEGPPGGLPPLPAAVEVAAYRIALEALTNVYHHAQASSCTVRFSIESTLQGKAMHLEIRDNGSGLPEHYQPGVGIHSMKERAEEVGGTCTVERLPGSGARVKAQFPI